MDENGERELDEATGKGPGAQNWAGRRHEEDWNGP